MNERNARTQEMLKAEGLYKGKIDGIIGPLTRRALELHNKQQYQPIPRQRPSGVSLAGSATPGGSAGGAATGSAQVVPGMTPMPPMPDSTAEINNPDYGASPGLNEAAGRYTRGIANLLAGHEVLPDPLKPSYPPSFSGVPSGAPLDDFALRNEIAKRRATGTLGELLSGAVRK